MKNNFCPNLGIPEVREEFNELVLTFGQPGAYLIWDKSNGDGIHNSDTFKDTLAENGGDRAQALIAAAKQLLDKNIDSKDVQRYLLGYEDVIPSRLEEGVAYDAISMSEIYKDVTAGAPKSYIDLADKVFSQCQRLGVVYRLNKDLGVSGRAHGTSKLVEIDSHMYPRTILHESIHMLTTYYLSMSSEEFSKQPQIVQDSVRSINEIFAKVRASIFRQAESGIKIGGSTYYVEDLTNTGSMFRGLHDVMEFTAELSNPQFIKLLYKYDTDKTWLQKLIDSIADLVGIDHHSSPTLQSAYSALEALIANQNEYAWCSRHDNEAIAKYESVLSRATNISITSDQEYDLKRGFSLHKDTKIKLDKSIGGWLDKNSAISLSTEQSNYLGVVKDILKTGDGYVANVRLVGVSEFSQQKGLLAKYETDLESGMPLTPKLYKEDGSDINTLYNIPAVNYFQKVERLITDGHLIRIPQRQNYAPLYTLGYDRSYSMVEKLCRIDGLSLEYVGNGRAANGSYVARYKVKNDTNNFESVLSICSFFLKKFPFLNIHYVSENDVPSHIDKKSCSYVDGTDVYIIQERCTRAVAIEECMHPFVAILYHNNMDLFNELFEEAKKSNPRLWSDIQSAYKGKGDFVLQNELVTQSLVALLIKQSANPEVMKRNTNKFMELAKRFWLWLSRITSSNVDRMIEEDNNLFYYYRENDSIIGALPKSGLKLMDIAQLVNSYIEPNITQEEIEKYTKSLQKHILHHLKTDAKSADIAQLLMIAYTDLLNAYRRSESRSAGKSDAHIKLLEAMTDLRRDQSYNAALIAAKHGIETLGITDIHSGLPMGYDPSDPSTYEVSLLAYLTLQKTHQFSDVTPEEIKNIYQNNISFYKRVIGILKQTMVSNAVLSDGVGGYNDAEELKTIINALENSIGTIESLWRQANYQVSSRVVENNMRKMSGVADRIEDLITVAKDWLHRNIYNDDVSSLGTNFGLLGLSKSPIIKLAFHMIQDANTKTLEEMMPILSKLLSLYKKANKIGNALNLSWQLMFYERDKDGVLTGNWVRDRNYGQYRKDLDEFTIKLNELFDSTYGFHYEIDSDGTVYNSATGQRADDEDWKYYVIDATTGAEREALPGEAGVVRSERPVWYEYQDQMYKWKCEHAELRYTYEYYHERLSQPYRGDFSMDRDERTDGNFHGLSPKTLSKYNRINENLNIYLDMCTDEDGYVHPELLSDDNKRKLDAWQDAMDDLRNPFTPNGEQKGYEDYQAAFEILAWERFINRKLNTKAYDYSGYGEQLNEVIRLLAEWNAAHPTAAPGTGPNYIYDFYKYNSKRGINPLLEEMTHELMNRDYDIHAIGVHAQIAKNALLRLAMIDNAQIQHWLRDGKAIDVFKLDNPLYQRFKNGIGSLENQADFWNMCHLTDSASAMFSDPEQMPGESDADYVARVAAIRKQNFDALHRLVGTDPKTGQPIYEAYFDSIPLLYLDPNGVYIDNNTGGPIDPSTVKPGDDVSHIKTLQLHMAEHYVQMVKNDPDAMPFVSDVTGNRLFYSHGSDVVDESGAPLSDSQIYDMLIEQVFSYTRYDSKGEGHMTPLSIFSVSWPKDEQFTYYDGNTYDSITDIPSRSFVEKYDDGTYINKKFDRKAGESEQPSMTYRDSSGREVYNNTEAFNKLGAVGSPIRDLYDALVELMKQSWATCGQSGRYDYRAPQLNTSAGETFRREVKDKGFKLASKNFGENIIKADANDLEFRTDDSYVTNPDGSRSLDVPLRFIHRLEDPNSITTDATGAVIMFADMAINHKNCKKISASLESLQYAMDPGNKDHEDFKDVGYRDAPNQRKLMKHLMEAILYENTYNVNEGDQKKAKLVKAAGMVRNTASVMMLGLNINSMIVGPADTLYRMLRESLLGKYFSKKDLAVGWGSFLKHMFKIVSNIGNPVANNKLTAMMLLNNIGTGITTRLMHQNKSTARKVAESFVMGGFSLMDYMSNAILLRAHYNNVHFIDDNGIQGFFTEWELQRKYMSLKDASGNRLWTDKEAKQMAKNVYKHSNMTLWDAYIFENGYATVDPKFTKYLNDNGIDIDMSEAKNRVRTKTTQRSALYTGVKPSGDQSIVSNTWWGKAVLLMRNFFTNNAHHLLSGGDDFSVRELETVDHQLVSGGRTYKVNKMSLKDRTDAQKSQLMAYNFETGMPEDLIFTGLWRTITLITGKAKALVTASSSDRKMSEVESYAVKSALIFVLSILALMVAWMGTQPFGPDWWEGYHNWQVNYRKEKLAQMSKEQRKKVFSTAYYPIPFTDSGKNFVKYVLPVMIDNCLFRLTVATASAGDPTQTIEMVNDVSTVVQSVGDVGVFFNLPINAIQGNLGKDITNGKYAQHKVWERDLAKGFGVPDNVYSSFSVNGQESGFKWYLNAAPNKKFFTPFNIKMSTTKNTWETDDKENAQKKKKKSMNNPFGDQKNPFKKKNPFSGGKNPFGDQKNPFAK